MKHRMRLITSEQTLDNILTSLHKKYPQETFDFLLFHRAYNRLMLEKGICPFYENSKIHTTDLKFMKVINQMDKYEPPQIQLLRKTDCLKKATHPQNFHYPPINISHIVNELKKYNL